MAVDPDIYRGPFSRETLAMVERTFSGLDAEDISLEQIARVVDAAVEAERHRLMVEANDD